MSRAILFLVTLLISGMHGMAATGFSSIIFTNLNKRHFVVDLSSAPTNMVKVNLSTSQFDTGGTSITITNINGISGNLWTNDAGVYRATETETSVHVTNVLSEQTLVALGAFIIPNSQTVGLFPGTNQITPYQNGTMWIQGADAIPDHSILSLSSGNGQGQLLILQNHFPNSGFSFLNGATNFDGSGTNKLVNGDWKPVVEGEGLLIFNDGNGWNEISRFGNTNGGTIVITNITITDTNFFDPTQFSYQPAIDNVVHIKNGPRITNLFTLDGVTLGTMTYQWPTSGTNEGLLSIVGVLPPVGVDPYPRAVLKWLGSSNAPITNLYVLTNHTIINTNSATTNLVVTNLFIMNTNFFNPTQFFYDPNGDNVVNIKNQPRITNAILSQVITVDGLAYSFPTQYQPDSVLYDATGSGVLSWGGSLTNPINNLVISNLTILNNGANLWTNVSGVLRPINAPLFPISIQMATSIPKLTLLSSGVNGSQIISSNYIDLVSGSSSWRMQGVTFGPNQAGSLLASSTHPLTSLYTHSVTWGDGGSSLGRTNAVADSYGNGSPEGAVAAGIGSVRRSTNDGSIYVKTSGDGNTGWTLLFSGVTPTNQFRPALVDSQNILVPVAYPGVGVTNGPSHAYMLSHDTNVARLLMHGLGSGGRTSDIQMYAEPDGTTEVLFSGTGGSLVWTEAGLRVNSTNIWTFRGVTSGIPNVSVNGTNYSLGSGGGGGGGNMTNSGASVSGNLPIYTDTTGTQLTPTNAITLDAIQTDQMLFSDLAPNTLAYIGSLTNLTNAPLDALVWTTFSTNEVYAISTNVNTLTVGSSDSLFVTATPGITAMEVTEETGNSGNLFRQIGALEMENFDFSGRFSYGFFSANINTGGTGASASSASMDLETQDELGNYLQSYLSLRGDGSVDWQFQNTMTQFSESTNDTLFVWKSANTVPDSTAIATYKNGSAQVAALLANGSISSGGIINATNGFGVASILGITTTWTNVIPLVITQRITAIGGIIVTNKTL